MPQPGPRPGHRRNLSRRAARDVDPSVAVLADDVVVGRDIANVIQIEPQQRRLHLKKNVPFTTPYHRRRSLRSLPTADSDLAVHTIIAPLTTVATSVGRNLISAMLDADAAAILTWWCIASAAASPSTDDDGHHLPLHLSSIHRHRGIPHTYNTGHAAYKRTIGIYFYE